MRERVIMIKQILITLNSMNGWQADLIKFTFQAMKSAINDSIKFGVKKSVN